MVELATLPFEGTHFLQIQNPDGLFSNDFIFHAEPGPNPFDLQGKELQFLRRPKGMSAVRAKVGFKSLVGDRVNLGDDGAVFLAFPDGEVLELGDGSHRGFWVHSDGHLTFGRADTATSARSVGRFTNGPPRIAALFTDVYLVGNTVINQSGRVLSVFLIWMVFYLTLSLIISVVVNFFNVRLAIVER